MKITLLTIGSKGDVRPFIALGLGLKNAGSDITVATNSSFEQEITNWGLRFIPLDTDSGEMESASPDVRVLLDASWEAAQGADAIVYHPRILAGFHILDKLRIPGFVASPSPMLTPSSDYSNPALGGRQLGGFLNRLSYTIARYASFPYAAVINKWRKDVLGLESRSRFANDFVRDDGPIPILYCYSPNVLPFPKSQPPEMVVTGYWFLNSLKEWSPPKDLVDFLDAGDPPVYIELEIASAKYPRKLMKTILEAVEKAKHRAIIADGWDDLRASDLPASVFPAKSVPYDWLFPRVSTVIHSGRADILGQALRAGRTNVVFPSSPEETFWGKTVENLGVGPNPIPQRSLTASNFCNAILLGATYEIMRRRSNEIGRTIFCENGTGQAIDLINSEIISRSFARI